MERFKKENSIVQRGRGKIRKYIMENPDVEKLNFEQFYEGEE